MLIDHRWGLVNSKLSLAESADMQPQKLVSADFVVAMGRECITRPIDVIW